MPNAFHGAELTLVSRHFDGPMWGEARHDSATCRGHRGPALREHIRAAFEVREPGSSTSPRVRGWEAGWVRLSARIGRVRAPKAPVPPHSARKEPYWLIRVGQSPSLSKSPLVLSFPFTPAGKNPPERTRSELRYTTFNTCSGVRPKAIAFASVGTRFATAAVPIPWSSSD